jgi:1-acyl-sn-glycerol-3-phosphate acyltransferase
MFTKEDFEDIRPYNDNEINPALKRILAEPVFNKILEFIFPHEDRDQIAETLSKVDTSIDFQKKFMHPLVYSLIKKTSDGLTHDGFEQLNPATPYLFVANHRDIVLDSAILQALLLDNGHMTSEITFGSNLMINQFVIDLGRVNRMFKVERGGNKIELIKNSQKLSAYIRYTITEKKNSVWIAQRPGRTKNGSDKTEAGLLKMFNMSSQGSFTDSFQELNIVPLVISYEYEPCCAYKINESMIKSQNGTYQKKPGEDFQSIVSGLTQPKGRIHLSIGKPINPLLARFNEEDSKNDRICRLAEMIDFEIYKHYKLWPVNYIAFDKLNDSNEFAEFYSPDIKEQFLKYMEIEIKGIEGDRKAIEKIFLEIYANPLNNYKKNILRLDT